MKPWSQLTRRGQDRRLRHMAEAALHQYDLPIKHLSLLTHHYNCSFRLDTSDGQRYVLRINRPGQRALAEINSEMIWLDALRRETDLGVPYPIATSDGRLMTTVEVAGVPEPRHCAVFSWVPGPDLAQHLTPANLVLLGELTARLHHHSDSWTPPAEFWLKTMDAVMPFAGPVIFFDEHYATFFPPERQAIFAQALERAQQVLDRLNADRSQLRVIHADLHQWNLKVQRGKLYALDFDDCAWGYQVQDVGITLYYLQNQENYAALSAAYAEGYCKHRPWPEQVAGDIDALIAARGMMLLNYFLPEMPPERAHDFAQRTEQRLQRFLNQESAVAPASS